MHINKIMNKTIIFGIILLIFTVSIYPTIGKTNEMNENYMKGNSTISENGLLLADDIAYIQGTFELQCWLYQIQLNNPGGESCICPDFPGSGSGGTWTSDGFILTSEEGTGILYEIDPLTCEWKSIGEGGFDLNGLAYDPISKKTYACSGGRLFRIDRTTGDQDLIDKFSGEINNMISISFDADGQLYGWNLDDNLYRINKHTAATSLVGSLDIDLDLSQDGAFHLEDDILYLAAYTSDQESYLYECDEDTGACTLVGQFSENTQVTLFAIPWNYPPVADFIFSPTDPEPGEEIEFDASGSTDPDGNIELYQWDWDNDGVYDESGPDPTTTHIFEEIGIYPVTLNVKDQYSANNAKMLMVKVGNIAPETPSIDGPTTGKQFRYYNYTVTIVDPDGDMVYVRWDWGNGVTYPWDGPYESGVEITESYVWNTKGTYIVKAQVKDEYNAESEWGELEVKIPRNNMQQHLLLLELIERHPFLKHIISFLGWYNWLGN
jgi:PKD repeat protein